MNGPTAFLRSCVARLRSGLRANVHRCELEAEMEAELANHLEARTEDLIRAGHSPEEAARRARIELGPTLMHKENMRASVGLRWIDELAADLRYAFRMLRKSPGFTAIAVGSLALGIGANTAIFTVAQHMLLDRLTVPHPDRLRLLEWTQPSANGAIQDMWGWFEGSGNSEVSTSFSYPVYEQMRRQNRSLEELLAFKPLGMTVNVNGQAELDDVEMVSGNYFSALGVHPQLGRAIEEADDSTVGGGPVVVISERFWTEHFGRSPAAIGKTILVNTSRMTIVGVAPRGFTGAYSAQGKPAVFLPLSMQPIVSPPDWSNTYSPNLLTDPKLWWVLVMGRAKAGVPDATAAAELNVTMNAAVRATMPVEGKALPRLLLIDGSRGQNPAAENLSKPIYLLLGLAGFVLLLACANLANLLLARGSARRREMSLRVAIGAARWRILRQALTENLTLSFIGGVAGLALAYAVRNTIPRLMAAAWDPPAFAARFDWRIFGFALLVSVATGFVFGLGPAWAATRVELSTALKDGARTATQSQRGLAGKTIVVVQVAMSMVLVVGAGLFVRTMADLTHARLGFNPDHITLFGIAAPQAKYPHAAATRLFREIELKLAAIPGVERAAVTRTPLISGSVTMHTFVPEGTARKKDGENPSVLMNDVGRNFFAMFEIPIVAGRGFDSTDTETSRKVAVVNEALAKKYFPNENPIGRTFEDGFHTPTQIEIVGVCADAKYDRIRRDPEPTFYMPYWEDKDTGGWTNFAVKARMQEAELAPLLRKAVASVDGNLPVQSIHTQREQIDATMRNERLFADLTAGFGMLALVLAAVGIYGILAYSVSQRTSEIGIRIALGARQVTVLGMVLREAAWMAGLGILVGLGAAMGIGRLIASLLYGLKAWDPATLAGAAGVLAMTALAAAWIPARRAASVQPMTALRHE
jgi:predicted permease